MPGDPTGRRVADALAEERPRLLPLTAHPFPCDLVRTVSSGKTPYLRFDGNDYSIPHTLIRRPLTLVASEHQALRDEVAHETPGLPRVFFTPTSFGFRLSVDGAQILSFRLRTHDVGRLRPRGGEKLHRKWRDDFRSVTF